MEDPQTVPSTPVPPPPSASVHAGLSDNAAGALAYVTVIPAILFLVLDPYNKRPFVRFHSFQCIGLVLCWIVLSAVCGAIPFLGWFILAPLVSLAMLCIHILCIVKAYSGVIYKLPLIGNYAEKFSHP